MLRFNTAGITCYQHSVNLNLSQLPHESQRSLHAGERLIPPTEGKLHRVAIPDEVEVKTEAPTLNFHNQLVFSAHL
jgi:hypothetical protein